jgi:U2 small nuclear ribonucleoprotein B''
VTLAVPYPFDWNLEFNIQKILSFQLLQQPTTTVINCLTMEQPNATLYIKNLDWKIKKGLLRRALYALFTRHGKVLEIVTLRRDGLRGQAFVIMNTVQSATAALQAEQGFTFFGKDLVIEYARQKSNRIAKRDGDYVPKAKRSKLAASASSATSKNQSNTNENGDMAVEESESTLAMAVQPPSVDNGDGVNTPHSPPFRILLAQNLPAECNEMMLGMLFQQYAGYKEIRMPRPGLAFVEFDTDEQATIALTALHGFKLTPKDLLNLSYSKASP